MNQQSAFPLSWPLGWPRTDPAKRERGVFQTKLPAALENLKRQLKLMGAKELVLSSNYTLGAENPKDPGVVAYFAWESLALAIPCDRWNRIDHNVRAIALTVDAMRGMERWGAKHMIRSMFTGFRALPERTEGSAWWTVLGVEQNASAEQVKEAYRLLARKHHPDGGGDEEMFRRVQGAWDHFEGLYKRGGQ